MNTVDRLNFVRDGMNVRRYHQYTTVEKDTVGKHSAGVALLAHLIDPGARKEVLLAALFHDLGECVLGDIPSPTKKRLSEQCRDELDAIEVEALEDHGFDTQLLNEDEVALLKLCDCLDGLSFCVEERRRGNRTLNRVGEKYKEYILAHMQKCLSYPWFWNAQELTHIINNSWSEANVR